MKCASGWRTCDCGDCEEYREILATWNGECIGEKRWGVCPCERCAHCREMERDYLDGIAEDVERTIKELEREEKLRLAGCDDDWTRCSCLSCERERREHIGFLAGVD